MKTGLCVACAALVCGVALAGKTDLRGITAIYVDNDAPKEEKDAASRFADLFGKAIGTKVAVNPKDRPYSPTAENALFLGKRLALESGLVKQADLDKLVWDGFAIGFGGGRAAIAGNRDTSVNNGVVELLLRIGYILGDYHQTPLDPQPTFVFEDRLVARSPAFEYRSGSWIWWHRTNPGLRGNPKAALDSEVLKSTQLDNTHTANYLVPKQIYQKDHPEYYAMNMQGERKLTSDNDFYTHLCLSNPDVQRIAVERMVGWVKMQPGQIYFGVSQGDGHDWCQCDACKAHDAEPGNYSDRILKLLVNPVARAVAKVRPDAKIVMLSYCGSDEPAVRERLEPNAYIMYCPYHGIALSMAHPMTHPLNAEARRQFEGWCKIAPDNLKVYEYNIGAIPSWEAWGEKLKWYHEKGVRTGIVMCGIPAQFRWLFAHIHDQLSWDIDADVKQVMKRYLRAVYGPAAPHLEDYFDEVNKRLDKGYAMGIHGCSWTGYFSEGAIARMLGAFDRALAAVAGDERRTRDLKAEREHIVGAYLWSVDAAILSGEKQPPSAADLKGKVGALDWKITRADRASARRLVAERLRGNLDDLAAQEAVLADETKQKAHTKATEDAKKAVRSMRWLLERFGPMTLPEDAPVAELARLYLEKPEQAVAKHPYRAPPAAVAEPLPGGNGVLLPAAIFRDAYGPVFYSWWCKPGRNAAIIYAPRSPRPSVMRASFTLEKAPAGGAILDMEGQDSQNDLLPPAHIRVVINGKTVYEGDCGFVKKGWSRRDFPVAAGVLKAGENMIEIRNVYEGTARLDGWWFALSEAKLTFGK